MTHTGSILTGVLLAVFVGAPTLISAQWVQCGLSGFDVLALGTTGSNLYASTWGHSVYRSTDYGETWDSLDLGSSNVSVWAFAVDDTELFAAGSYLYRSADNGLHWAVVDSSLVGLTSVAVCGDHLLAGTWAHGIYGSSDHGRTWRVQNVGLTDYYIHSLAFVDSTAYAGAEWDGHPNQGGHVFSSTNFGENWTVASTGLPDKIINHLTPIEGAIYVCLSDYGGVYRSTDEGRNWAPVTNGLHSVIPMCITGVGTNFCVGGQYFGANPDVPTDCIYRLSGAGAAWSSFSTGMEATYVGDLKVLGPYLFAATMQGSGKNGVWRRSLSDLTEIRSVPGMPISYTLDQNFPNPFNPTTTIHFGIPKQADVTIKIFDILGRNVADLISTELPPGFHSYEWDAREFSNGVYFCVLRCGDIVLTRKLLLTK